MVLDDLLQDVPDLGALALDELLGALHGLYQPLLLQLADDEGLEEFQGHALGKAALVQAQIGADDDHRPARVVDPLAQQVLAEAPLLALEQIGEGLEGPVAVAAHRTGPAAVVEKGVHSLLEHALLVAQDDLRRLDGDQLLQAVVAVDHAPVKVVQVGGGEPPSLEGHERPQVGRDDGNHLQDHPVRTVLRLAESLHHLQPLQGLLLALDGGLHAYPGPQLRGQLLDVDLHQQVANRRGPHADGRGVALLAQLHQLLLGEEGHLLHRRVLRIHDHVRLVVEDALQVAHRDVEEGADPAGEGLEVPDVGNGNGQLDVAEPLATDLGLGHLDTATVADHAPVADSLVLAAVAVPVLHRPEDALAEQAVPLGLEGTVVDRLRLGDLPVGPGANGVG